jgi:hypothetical protein
MNRTLISLLLAAALVLAWILVGLPVFDGHSSRENQEAFGHLSAVLALGAFTALLLLLGLKLKGLVVGRDNRVSTSKVQALVWTYALAWALLSLIFTKWAGADAGYQALLKEGIKEEYLILLGGPFAAAILAKGIVSNKAATGQIAKTEGTPEPKQIFSSDDGSTDLVDTQYVVFNLVALVYFIGAFIDEASDGLPQLPEVLVALTGVAAAAYVSNKVVLNQTPTLSSLLPGKGAQGSQVTIYGRWLRLPKLENGQQVYEDAQVTFDGRLAQVDAAASESTTSGEDKLKATVPTIPGLTAEKAVEVQAVSALGTKSNTLPFTVEV